MEIIHVDFKRKKREYVWVDDEKDKAYSQLKRCSGELLHCVNTITNEDRKITEQVTKFLNLLLRNLENKL